MRALNRKLVRDLWHLRGQMIAIALVVACGVAVFVTTRTAYQSLQISRRCVLRRVPLRRRLRAPQAGARRGGGAAGARSPASPRWSRASSSTSRSTCPASPSRPPAACCRFPSGGCRSSTTSTCAADAGSSRAGATRCIVSEAFANANQLEVGDTLGAILNGRWERLRIVGVALSPEYVYEIRGTRHLSRQPPLRRAVDEPRRDGAGVRHGRRLQRRRPRPGARRQRGRRHRRARPPPRALRRPAARAGATSQVSHRFLSDEIAQNQVFGTVLPAIFLGVAAFLLNIVLSRLVATQRDQIAVLKAFGYGHWTVAAHYLGFAVVAVALGGAVGTGLGIWLGMLVNRMYVDFYRFPVLRFEAGVGVVGPAIAIAGGAALLGAWAAARRALALPPAEAMRPEPPPQFPRRPARARRAARPPAGAGADDPAQHRPPAGARPWRRSSAWRSPSPSSSSAATSSTPSSTSPTCSSASCSATTSPSPSRTCCPNACATSSPICPASCARRALPRRRRRGCASATARGVSGSPASIPAASCTA